VIALGAMLPLGGMTDSTPGLLLSSTRSLASVLSRMPPVPALAFGLGQGWRFGDPGLAMLWAASAAILSLLTVMVIAHFHRFAKSTAGERQAMAGLTFLYLAAIVGCAALAVSFIGLSMRQGPDSDWLIVQEGRYYAPIFGLLAFIAAVNVLRPLGKGRLLVIAGVGLLVCLPIVLVKTWRDLWPLRANAGRAVRMDARDPGWRFYFAIRKLREEGREVVFLTSDRSNWFKAWAGAAGASIHRSIHTTELSDPITPSRPVTIVALATPDSPAVSLAALRGLVRRGTVVHSSLTDRSELYVLEPPGGKVSGTVGDWLTSGGLLLDVDRPVSAGR